MPDAWSELQQLILHSLSINSHLDFVRWLQKDVRSLLNHEVLIAAWGDFETCSLNFDVASSSSELRTADLSQHAELGVLMQELHRRWLECHEHWYTVDHGIYASVSGARASVALQPLTRLGNVLVHGVRDRRTNQDYLYAFFDRHAGSVVSGPLLEFILPQIDMALRRVESLPPPQNGASPLLDYLRESLTTREHEIMQWVKAGKTNYEIGLILSISPNTVKNHLKRIFGKLDVSNRAQAVVSYEHLR